MDARRLPQDTGTLNVYFYLTLRISSTVTFPALPGFSVTLPAAVNPAGLQFFYAISNPQPVDGAQAQFRMEGPASVSGQTVTFAASTTPLTLQVGRSYTIALYAISAIAAKPTATPFAGKIYVASDGYSDRNGTVPSAVTTYTANGTQTTPTIELPAFPTGLAVDAVGKIYVSTCGGGPTSAGVTTYTADGIPATPSITGFTCPLGIALDSAGKIYVTDTAADNTSVLMTYTANGTRTAPTISGGLGEAFDGVAVDAAGKIYIADFYSGVVRTYGSDGTPGTPTVTEVPNREPQGIAVDAAGKIYVANNGAGAGSVTTYTATGTPTIPTIAAGAGVVNIGVAVDASGKIYVATGNVTTYGADGTRTTPTISPGFNSATAVTVH